MCKSKANGISKLRGINTAFEAQTKTQIYEIQKVCCCAIIFLQESKMAGNTIQTIIKDKHVWKLQKLHPFYTNEPLFEPLLENIHQFSALYGAEAISRCNWTHILLFSAALHNNTIRLTTFHANWRFRKTNRKGSNSNKANLQ